MQEDFGWGIGNIIFPEEPSHDPMGELRGFSLLSPTVTTSPSPSLSYSPPPIKTRLKPW